MTDTIKLLETTSSFNFPDFFLVYNRPSIADLIPLSRRCGIYILKFKDSSFYVGQAVDIARRYAQHRKNHDDIEGISFRKFRRKELNEVERILIKVIEEKEIMLRNISLTSLPKGDIELDILIPRDQQEYWLKNAVKISGKQTLVQPEQQLRYARKHNLLSKEASYQTIVLPFLKEYFKYCIVSPSVTEMTYWSITCLSQEATEIKYRVLVRLSLYWCEVLTLCVRDGEICFSFHLAKSGLSEDYIYSLGISSIEIDDHYYNRGGPDQFNLIVEGLDDALKLLSDKKVVQAIKTFNLRQMQKGATVYSKFHCMDLARDILYLKNEI